MLFVWGRRTSKQQPISILNTKHGPNIALIWVGKYELLQTLP